MNLFSKTLGAEFWWAVWSVAKSLNSAWDAELDCVCMVLISIGTVENRMRVVWFGVIITYLRRNNSSSVKT